MKSRIKWALISLVLILVLGVGARQLILLKLNGKNNGGNLATLTKSTLVQRVTIAGTVVPARKTLITAPYNGYIKRIFVKIGDDVKKGSPVVTLVQSLLQGEDVFPIRSPFPGKVVQVNNQSGEYVVANDSKGFMVRIDDLSTLYVSASVPEIDRLKIKPGQEAVIKASAILGRSYMGIIEEVALAASENEDYRSQGKVEYPIKIRFENPDASVHPGMSTIIDIIANKAEDILTLRHEFIQKIGEDFFVVLEDGEKRQIQVGIQNEEMFEVRSGLVEGDKVRQTDFFELYSETNG